MKTRHYLWLAILFFVAASPARTQHVLCSICGSWREPPTLVEQFQTADVVLFGRWQGIRQDAKGNTVTDFTIEQVIKHKADFKATRTFTVAHKVDKSDAHFLVFCDFRNGQLDPYSGIKIASGGELVKYMLEGARLKDEARSKRLKQCLAYLSSKEEDVAKDALREFDRSAYSDFKDLAKSLPADKIIAQLRDPKTPAAAKPFYGLLLGHCGKAEDAGALRKLIDAPGQHNPHQLWVGYIMLEPTAGWRLLQQTLGDPRKSFLERHACQSALRFLWQERQDLITKTLLLACEFEALAQPDMADLAVNDLSQFQCWEATPRVLELYGKKGFEAKIIKRAIVRFALQSTDVRAAAFIGRERERHGEFIAETEEILQGRP